MPPKDSEQYKETVLEFQDEFGKEEASSIGWILLFQIRNELRTLNELMTNDSTTNSFTPSTNFSDGRNSQYIVLI